MMSALGARPAGTNDDAQAAQSVQQMFDLIAPQYDLLNHLLSANFDRLWWWRAARRFRPILANPEAAIVDICCGTGDMTLALLSRRPANARPILAADFSHGMLVRGERKFAARKPGKPAAVTLEADALHLPLSAASLDLIITAFGFRNLANYEAGLREFYRVLKPGGQLGILEFSQPGGLFGRAYAIYFRHILPAIGRLICGKEGPYKYLPASVSSFPTPSAMLALMAAAGYDECSWQPYTFGIAGLYTATRPEVA
jgi:demethylmenaquinone methyltransferase / 2-methoxy-6-polyprenyl-1,4-benzoquinol methylase